MPVRDKMADPNDDLRRLLPPDWAAIMDIIGPLPLLPIIEQMGGALVLLPTTSDRSTWLVKFIGSALCQEVIDRIGGGRRVSVPVGRYWLAAMYFRNGLSVPRIAIKLRVSDRTVRRIKLKLTEGGFLT